MDRVRDVFRQRRSQYQQLCETYPKTTSAAKSVTIVGLCAVATPVVANLAIFKVLGGLGLTATGPGAATVASGIQSSVYGGFTTGVFSYFQSLAAFGTLSNTATGVCTFAGAALGMAGLKYNRRKNEERGKDK